MEDKIIKLYKDLQDSGYDLFNINDPFYNDLCSPYKSENGTDVLLSDRKNDYYNNDNTTCQSNCQYSSFNPEYKFLKCECKVIVDDIDVNNLNKFRKKVFNNFYDVLKNSNYKVMKCYKLVFNWKYLKKNIGSFIVSGLFIIYICFFIIYIIKGITPLKEASIKNINYYNNNFPPKKRKQIINDIVISNAKENKEKRESHLAVKKKRKKKLKEHVSNINYQPIQTKTKMNTTENKDSKNALNTKEIKSNEKNKIKNNNNNNNNKLDDLDLNNSTYEKALEFDKRTLLQIYWSKLKLKHLIIYTFISCHDYNLQYIKISRFVFLVCTSMALNVFFFFDSSMHKIYLDYGKYNFIQQLPQILYSTIVSLIIEILIGILSFTDINLYQIRQLEQATVDNIEKILKKIKMKLMTFFIITFLLFFFYWYFISAFCAVYNNTQIIYIKDFISSFSIGLLYPFIIQFVFSLIRIFTLREKTKVRSLLYKVC